jgi:small subunit ribosomal protein S9
MNDPKTATKKSQSLPKYFYGVGRRKTATARAKVYEGENKLEILINKRSLKEYFQDYYAKVIIDALGNMGVSSGNVHFFIKGGGTMAQSEAARLALVKALRVLNPEMGKLARSFGYMTSDNRNVYPKKAGRRKSRKVEQWSKR